MKKISTLEKIILGLLIFFISGMISCVREMTTQHTLLNEDIIDSPEKTQITLKLMISGKITSDSCRELLNRLYSEYREKTGLKNSPTPNNLLFYLYDSAESAEEAEQWIGMLSWSSEEYKPRITIKEDIIAELNSDSSRKFGLSEKKRKKIFEDIVLARDRATSDAEKKYPLPLLNTVNREDQIYTGYPDPISAKKVSIQINKQTDYIKKTVPVYVKAVLKKHKINEHIFTAIAIEGFKKKWPLPSLEGDQQQP